MSTKRQEWWKGQLCLVSLVILFLVVLGRCWYLQVEKNEHFKGKAAYQQLKKIPQSARRGLIVDRKGQIMAISVPKHMVRLDPSIIEDPSYVARKLGTALQINADKLHKKILKRKNTKYMEVKRFISDQQLSRVKELKIRGIVIEREFQRQYPMGQLAAHVLGFTDIYGEGLEGVEARYDHYLREQPGEWRMKSDVHRRPIDLHAPAQQRENGKIVVLTIDSVIQNILEEQLQATVDKFEAKGATGIVMNPNSGEVLAMANYPTFDPKVARQTDISILRNRALTDPVEPGSLFKPITVVSALEGDVVKLHHKIDCLEGPYRGKGIGTIREYKYYFGKIPVTDVIARSSNIGTAKIAQKMGKSYFYDMLEKFGFGQKTGIDLYGEGRGILRPLSEWKWGEYALTRASYGQGPVATTPIQMIHGFCTLSNGGLKITPRVVKGVLSGDGSHVVKNFLVKPTSSPLKTDITYKEPVRIVSEKHAKDIVNKALTAVVNRPSGTAHNAFLEHVQVFGKTGTAQVPKKDGRGYEENKYVSSFIGGAPAERPKICVLIMVYQPDRSLGLGYTGGAVSASAVGQVIEQTLAYLDVEEPDQAIQLANQGLEDASHLHY